MKLCSKCGIEKELTAFRRDRKQCVCNKCAYLAWKQPYRSKINATKRALYRRNGESAREASRLQSARWRSENRDKANARVKAFYERNPAKRAAHCRERQTVLARAFPSWANKDAILKFYERARELTLLTGIRHDVDHIIPLRHPSVCGLHNEFNLQVLTSAENKAKHNKFLEVV